MVEAEPFIKTPGVSNLLKEEFNIDRKPSTLVRLRCTGGGPAFHRINRDVYYKPSTVRQWAIELISPPLRSTSDTELAIQLCRPNTDDGPEKSPRRRGRPPRSPQHSPHAPSSTEPPR
jgi:hypothetical protein